MKVKFLEPALVELDDAIRYYSEQVKGLDDKFFNDILDVIELIIKYPQAWVKNTDHTRKAVMTNFPFNIIYSIDENNIIIIAISHQHRIPEYWINRVKS